MCRNKCALYRQGRMGITNGLSFVPTTVRRTGMSNTIPRRDLVCATSTSEVESVRLWNAAVGAWVRRTWMAQLGQWKGVTGEIANAIAAVYPTPRAMHDAIWASKFNFCLIQARSISERIASLL